MLGRRKLYHRLGRRRRHDRNNGGAIIAPDNKKSEEKRVLLKVVNPGTQWRGSQPDDSTQKTKPRLGAKQ